MASEMITSKGNNYFEVASALQKTIRRGLVKEALYWGNEIANTERKDYFIEKNLWNRLLIISIEDVGPADWNAVKYVLTMYVNRKQKGALESAILYLAEAKKSRINDWASLIKYHNCLSLFISFEKQFTDALECKDRPKALEALYYLVKNKQTRKFSKNLSHKTIWNAMFSVAKGDIEIIKYLNVLQQLESNCYPYRTDKCYLIYIHFVHLWCSDRHSWMSSLKSQSSPFLDFPTIPHTLEIPDYAIDKHTIRGKQMGRDMKHFFDVGSRLENEDIELMPLSSQYLARVRKQYAPHSSCYCIVVVLVLVLVLVLVCIPVIFC